MAPAKLEVCKHGHRRTKANTRVYEIDGHLRRVCRICDNINRRLRRLLGAFIPTERVCFRPECRKRFMPKKRAQKACCKLCNDVMWLRQWRQKPANRRKLNAKQRAWNRAHPGYASGYMRRLYRRFEKKNGISYHSFHNRKRREKEARLAMSLGVTI